MTHRARIEKIEAECRGVWESINGADSWGANPWVWVIECKRVTA